MNKFIIQTRKESVQRGIDATVTKAFKELINGGESPWINTGVEFESVEDAKNKCVSMIENGLQKASNIRIVEVVCEFASKITVETK